MRSLRARFAAFFSSFFRRFFSFFSLRLRSSSARTRAISAGFVVIALRASCSWTRIVSSGSELSLFQVSFFAISGFCASRLPGLSRAASSASPPLGASNFFSPSRYASVSSDGTPIPIPGPPIPGPPLYMNSRRSTFCTCPASAAWSVSSCILRSSAISFFISSSLRSSCAFSCSRFHTSACMGMPPVCHDFLFRNARAPMSAGRASPLPR
mmetsp:Transcript_12871/g.53960  ORF Transcript_12871/g.53960 Transcript_12871/m.53960 type:complete len:211 (-) Transcript_12871:44-676(-)